MNLVRTLNAAEPIISPSGSRAPFYLVILYLLFEYGRPQESIPGLAVLHLPGIAALMLGAAIAFSHKVGLSDKQTRLFILLLALMAFHIPFALNNYWAFHTARAMLMTFVAYVGIVTFVDSPERFKGLITIWLGTHVYLAITSIIRGGRGQGGFLGDENDLSMTLTMVIPFTFFLALAETNGPKRVVYAVLTVTILAAQIVTLSRGGFVGLMAVGLYCWVRSPKKVASAALILLLVLFSVQAAPPTYWDEIRSIQQGTSDSSAEGRIYLWKIGWTMFLDNPVLGVGQGNFPFRFREYEISTGFYEGLHGTSRAGRAAHSLYFTLLPELGLVGALLWSLMLFHISQDLRLLRRFTYGAEGPKVGAKLSGSLSEPTTTKVFYLTLAMEASLIAYLVTGIFISVLYYPNFWILMAFVVALRKAWFPKR